MSNLRINLDDLLNARTVESERIEFKATWDGKVTGHQVLKTICAFANDLRRQGSGYIVIGVAEREGHADLPPRGLSLEQMEDAEKWIGGNCQRIDPTYVPRISREERDGRHLLVVWVPASETPPHQAPDGDRRPKKYWVRIDQKTVDAQKRGLLTPLMEQSATVPWDSRAALSATVDDLSEAMVREHLRDCGSALLDEPDPRTIYRKMDIVRRVNDHEVPRNVGLLFFSRDPTKWFPGAKIETSILRAGAGGDVLDEKVFKGGSADQIRSCLSYLGREVLGSRVEKVSNRLRASNRVNYPEDAVREVLVNALFHRGYADSSPHPTLVRVTSDRIDIRSTPGPVLGIEQEQLRRGGTPPLVPPRNPRIGELFKEASLAERRLTGLDKVYQAMERNGSPPPEFRFDEGRTFFQATLFAHPWQTAASAVRRAGELRAVGRPEEALDALESAWHADSASLVLAEELVRYCVAQGELDRAEPVVTAYLPLDAESARVNVVVPWLEALVEDGQTERAHRFLRKHSAGLSSHEAIGAAIVARRLRDEGTAAKLFEIAGPLILEDPRALLESAQNKLRSAGQAHRQGHTTENHNLLVDARFLLERVLRLDAPPRRHAWAWRELARARSWLREPASAVDEAYANAVRLAPDEPRFREEWALRTERGSSAMLEWQEPHLRNLTVPEHLYGPRILGDVEFRKQEAVLKDLNQAVENLRSTLSAALDEPNDRVRSVLKHVADAKTLLDDSGPRWKADSLQVARELTKVMVSEIKQGQSRAADPAASPAFQSVAQALAQVNMRFLAWLRPHLVDRYWQR